MNSDFIKLMEDRWKTGGGDYKGADSTDQMSRFPRSNAGWVQPPELVIN